MMTIGKVKSSIGFMIEEYQRIVQEELSQPHCGGTDWRFTDTIMPAFADILEITQAESILEFGFNAGASALMFLMLDNQLEITSVDLILEQKSVDYLGNKYAFEFIQANSNEFVSVWDYDLVFIDADHSYDAVVADINAAMTAKPKWILFDDVLHPSHTYIYDIIMQDERLSLEKLYEFNELWQGCSMALCKVK